MRVVAAYAGAGRAADAVGAADVVASRMGGAAGVIAAREGGAVRVVAARVGAGRAAGAVAARVAGLPAWVFSRWASAVGGDRAGQAITLHA